MLLLGRYSIEQIITALQGFFSFREERDLPQIKVLYTMDFFFFRLKISVPTNPNSKAIALLYHIDKDGTAKLLLTFDQQLLQSNTTSITSLNNRVSGVEGAISSATYRISDIENNVSFTINNIPYITLYEIRVYGIIFQLSKANNPITGTKDFLNIYLVDSSGNRTKLSTFESQPY